MSQAAPPPTPEVPSVLYIAGEPVRVLEELGSAKANKFRHFALDLPLLPWKTRRVARMPRAASPGINMLRLAIEERTLRQFAHPNLPHVFDEVDDEQTLRGFVTEELIFPGRGFWQYLYPNGGLTLDAFLVHAEELCDGLHALHMRGCTHGDPALRNIAFRPGIAVDDWTAVWADLEWSGELGKPSRGSEPNQFVFTPAYASSEQVRGGPITASAECASLAICLLSVLTGIAGYESKTAVETVRAVCEPALPDEMARRLADLPVPTALKDLLVAMRHPVPAHRPVKSADGFMRRLERIRALSTIGELAFVIPPPPV